MAELATPIGDSCTHRCLTMRPYGRHQICHRAFHRFQRRQVFEADFYVTKLEIGGERVEELNNLDDEGVLHWVTL